jgi:hypothetical protein
MLVVLMPTDGLGTWQGVNEGGSTLDLDACTAFRELYELSLVASDGTGR